MIPRLQKTRSAERDGEHGTADLGYTLRKPRRRRSARRPPTYPRRSTGDQPAIAERVSNLRPPLSQKRPVQARTLRMLSLTRSPTAVQLLDRRPLRSQPLLLLSSTRRLVRFSRPLRSAAALFAYAGMASSTVDATSGFARTLRHFWRDAAGCWVQAVPVCWSAHGDVLPLPVFRELGLEMCFCIFSRQFSCMSVG